MTLDGIIGNQDAVRALKGMVGSGRIPHAMMLYENDGCGAMAIVNAFLGEIFNDEHKACRMIHPDIHYVYPVANGSKVKEKVENLRSSLFLNYWRDLMAANPYALESEVDSAFGIEGKLKVINAAQAKEILETVYLSPVEGGYKAVVIYLPEKMNSSSANRLLKAIEEPPEKTLFLMVTHAPDKVLQTISSRCQAVRIMPQTKEEVRDILVGSFGKEESAAREAALSAGGSVGEALQFLSENEESRGQEELFGRMMSAVLARDLTALLDCADTLAGQPSKERQKAFCRYASEALRKIFLLQQKLDTLVGIREGQEELYSSLAKGLRKNFPRLALGCLDKADLMLDRNVNPKIIFCDLAGQLYMLS